MSEPSPQPSASVTHLAWEVAVSVAALVVLAIVFLWPQPAAMNSAPVAVGTAIARARSLRAAGHTDLALVEIGKAVAYDAENREARFLLAEILRERRQFAAALAEYDAVIATGEDAAARIGRGLAGLESANVDAAISDFRRATELDPRSSAAFIDLAIALLRAGRAVEAVPIAEQGSSLAPDNLDAKHNWGYALREAGRGQEAVAVLTAVVAAAPNRIISLYELARAHADVGDRADAIATVTRLLTLEPGHKAAAELRTVLESP